MWFFVLLLSLSSPALAGDKSKFARGELRRLTMELDMAVRKGAWRKVERSYLGLRALEKDGIVIPHQFHVQAARSAQARGDLTATLQRLKAANAVEQKMETLTWLANIEVTFGEVNITVSPGFKTMPTLEGVLDVPFDPTNRKALELAQRQIAETGQYSGLLPMGQYTLGAAAFDIYGGPPQRVVIKPKRVTMTETETIAVRESLLGKQLAQLTLLADATQRQAWQVHHSEILKTLKANPFVSEVIETPLPEMMVLVEFDAAALQAANHTSTQIAEQIQTAENIPLGRLKVGENHIYLYESDISSLERLKHLTLALYQDAPLTPEEIKANPAAAKRQAVDEPESSELILLQHVARFVTLPDPKAPVPSFELSLRHKEDVSVVVAELTDWLNEDNGAKAMGLITKAK